MAMLQIPDAHRFAPHGNRGSASQDLEGPGSPWAAVASAGVWNSPSRRGYLDMSRDVETGVMRLFGGDMDSDAESDQAPWG